MPIPTNPHLSDLDQTQILQRSFDESTDRLRVDADLTVDSVVVEVELDYHNDSVAIGDPSTDGILKIYPNGSIDANVEVDAADGDNIAISDGTNTLAINPDGSINVTVEHLVNSVISIFAQVSSVPSSVLTTIVSYTAVAGDKLKRGVVSGSNIASYDLLLNGSTIDRKRTYFGADLNSDFFFDEGLDLSAGDVIMIKVIHTRPSVGDFNGRIEVAQS